MRIIRDNAINKLKMKVQEGKRIICIGAGHVVNAIDDMFEELGLLQYVDGFVDSNQQKVGKDICFNIGKYEIYSFEWLQTIDLSRIVFVITIERFPEIVNKLQEFAMCYDVECFLIADLNYEYSKKKECSEILLPEAEYNTIPKIIHYCWFGQKKMPEYMYENIHEWKRLNPEYQIVCHDESDYDVKKNQYIERMYEEKFFAFVSDYARLDILYQYGGIYLDTDVKLLQKLDNLLGLEAFISYNIWPEVNSGIIGAKAGNELIKEMLEVNRNPIDINGDINKTTNNIYETAVLSKYGFKRNFTRQCINGMWIIPPGYLTTVSAWAKNADITDKTIAVHVTEGSWRKDGQ